MVSSGSKNLKFSIKFWKYDIVFGSIQKVIQKSSVLNIGKAFTEMTGRICRRSGMPSSPYISYQLSVYIFWRMIHINIRRTGHATPATVGIASPANEQSPCSFPLCFAFGEGYRAGTGLAGKPRRRPEGKQGTSRSDVGKGS